MGITGSGHRHNFPVDVCMLNGAAGFKLEVVVGGEMGWRSSGDHDGGQLSGWVVSLSLKGFQAFIVFEQGGFSEVLEVGFIGVSEATPEGQIKLEQCQLVEVDHASGEEERKVSTKVWWSGVAMPC
jgi:hypothetical protein